MRRGWLFACSILSCTVTQAQVYKCIDQSGSKVFQQQPCAGGKKLMEKSASRGPVLASEDTPAGSYTGPDPMEVNRRFEIRVAIESHRPMVGMTEDELREAVGAPSKLNVSNYSKQWIYRGPKGKDGYVYTYDGVVTSVEWPNNFRSGPSKVGSEAHRGVRWR